MLLVLAELNPDVVVSVPGPAVSFGQREQLVEHAAITLGSSGAITAAAAVDAPGPVSGFCSPFAAGTAEMADGPTASPCVVTGKECLIDACRTTGAGVP